MTEPEFSRLVRLDQVGAGESAHAVHAEDGERAALAARFALPSVDALDAHFTLRRDGAGVLARGHLSARVVQSCVVTGDPVPATVEEDFLIRFLPEPREGEEDEIELTEEECDTVFFTGGAIDLGEAAAETLALALDPFPRSAGAAQALKDAGVIREEEAGPFGALAGLRDRLGGAK